MKPMEDQCGTSLQDYLLHTQKAHLFLFQTFCTLHTVGKAFWCKLEEFRNVLSGLMSCGSLLVHDMRFPFILFRNLCGRMRNNSDFPRKSSCLYAVSCSEIIRKIRKWFPQLFFYLNVQSWHCVNVNLK